MMLIKGERAATACGLVAIVLWSTAAGLIRGVSEHFGPLGGAALIYSLGAMLLLVFLGRPRIRSPSRLYLVLGSALFVVTRRYAGGQNLVVLFFVLTSVVLWLKWFLSLEQIPPFTWANSLELLAAGIAMAGGYALWNIGILRGNLTLLATASYSAPVLSSAFAAVWLGVSLQMQFWQGSVLVTVGSLLCWQATRQHKISQATPIKVSVGENPH
jgi:drug/metabolite transporter (DMT)-like permease